MKATNHLLLLFGMMISTIIYGQTNSASTSNEEVASREAAKRGKLNFFIISKRQKGKLDAATRFNILRTKIKSTFRPNRFVAIVAADTEKAKAKILHRLKKHNANIGTIWFDSHGIYKRGYSLFKIGNDEVSYKNIRDSFAAVFSQLSVYTSNKTRIVIGSCYGGATYTRSSIDYKDTTRMNGDSLMMAIGNIFPEAKIYGSESWVMTKPGIFNNKKPAVAGYPKRKLFRDVCYRPAWENIGKWNEYSSTTKTFVSVNSVTLDRHGNLHVIDWSFNEKTDTQNDIRKNLARLGTGLYK